MKWQPGPPSDRMKQGRIKEDTIEFLEIPEVLRLCCVSLFHGIARKWLVGGICKIRGICKIPTGTTMPTNHCAWGNKLLIKFEPFCMTCVLLRLVESTFTPLRPIHPEHLA